MDLRINQVVFGLRAGILGATANRMGVWTQGCSLRKCPGCVSPHTWGERGGHTVAAAALVALAKAQAVAPTGLTISGGEPTDQADGVVALIDGFRSAYPDAEVVLYSGLRWPVLASRHPRLVGCLDVAVTGPYVRRLAATPLAGSANQEVQLLTPLARRLYRDWRAWPLHALQVGAGPDGIVTVGIPDAARLEKAARRSAAVVPPP